MLNNDGGPVFVPLGNRIFAGTNNATNSWIFQGGGGLSGTVSVPADGQVSPYHLFIQTDTVDTTTSGTGSLTGLSMTARATSGFTGIRQAIQGYQSVTGVPGAGSVYTAAVGVTGLTRIAANLGGATGVYTNYKGSGFGGNSNAYTTSGATFLNLINSHEFDVSLVSGASAADKYGISIVKGALDAVRGTYDDTAVSISDQAGASATWETGIKFGSYAHTWAFGADSTLIKAQQRTLPSPDSPIALYGVDFSAVTFTAGGGAGVVMPLITPASAAATGKAGSIVWDTGFIYVCTATNTWKKVAIATW